MQGSKLHSDHSLVASDPAELTPLSNPNLPLQQPENEFLISNSHLVAEQRRRGSLVARRKKKITSHKKGNCFFCVCVVPLRFLTI
jgi:hypothetical protein